MDAGVTVIGKEGDGFSVDGFAQRFAIDRIPQWARLTERSSPALPPGLRGT
jgi:hypothetical protein